MLGLWFAYELGKTRPNRRRRRGTAGERIIAWTLWAIAIVIVVLLA